MTAAVKERATSTDFDFWMGKWNVRNRRLARRLAGSDEWDEFESKVAARPLPGGLGNEDVFCTDYGGGFVGMSFRFYDPDTGLWSIYWADSRRPGLLDPPVIGSFSGDIGRLRGRRTRSTAARSACASPGRASRRRRRAGSRRSRTTAAETWETNWIMDFTRARGGGMSALERTVSVSQEYRHVEKIVCPEPSLALDDTVLKWYDIAPDDAPVPLGDPGRSRDAACGTRAAPATLGDAGRARLRRPPSLRRGLLLPARLHVAQRERALGDGVGEGRRRRRLLPAVADRGRAPPDVLRVGARSRLSRTAGMVAVPLLAARRDGPARLSPGHV